MAKKKKGIVFPRHVYKKDGPFEWNRGLTYDKKYVTNGPEYEMALEEGWIDSFGKALLGDLDTIDGEAEVVEKPKKTKKAKPFNDPIDDDDF